MIKRKFQLNREVMKMIENLANRYECPWVSRRDLIRAAQAKCLAVINDNKVNEAAMKAYLYKCAKGEMSKLLRDLRARDEEVLWLDGEMCNLEPVAHIVEGWQESKLADLIRGLMSENHFRALTALAWAEDRRSAIREIEKVLNVQRRHAELLLEDALERVRRSRHAKCIHNLLMDIVAMYDGDECRYDVSVSKRIEY